MPQRSVSDSSEEEFIQADHSSSSDPEQESQMDSAVLSPTELNIDQLIESFHADAYRYAFRLAGNVADAEDLTQHTFLIAQQKLQQLRDHSRARSWIFAILRSCFLRNLRKLKPINETSLQMAVDEIPLDVFSGSVVDRLTLQDAISRLPEDFRIVLLMFYFENLSYKEIAAKLGIKIGTVMSRLSRAKSVIREVILGEPEQEETV